ncbi:unnamed protein product [Nesidiocoris tenuis]|uniref:NHR domain-containing protein n=1 Tax=Nesidiocoris tenuis TaxID=355587 RepID=A0A6H5H5W7_9HEMI|nr:unnamed protein product [Nesidiocoris tenuis]
MMTCAARVADSPTGGLVFSSHPLIDGELFDVCIQSFTAHWAGSLALGVTPSPPAKYQSFASLPEPYWYIQGNSLMYCGEVLKPHYCSSIEWLRPGNRLGVKRCADSSLHFYIDGVDQGIGAFNVPKGRRDRRMQTKRRHGQKYRGWRNDFGNSRSGGEDLLEVDSARFPWQVHYPNWNVIFQPVALQFHECHGRNVQISESRLAAKRVSSYNQGVVLAARGLPRGVVFQIKSRYGVNLDTLGLGSTVGVMVDSDNQLRITINGRDQGVAATNISANVNLPLVDLYGACDQACIVTESSRTPLSPCAALEHVWSDSREKGNLEVREKPGTLRTKSDKMNENIQCSSQNSPTTASLPPPATLILEVIICCQIPTYCPPNSTKIEINKTLASKNNNNQSTLTITTTTIDTSTLTTTKIMPSTRLMTSLMTNNYNNNNNNNNNSSTSSSNYKNNIWNDNYISENYDFINKKSPNDSNNFHSRDGQLPTRAWQSRQ